MSEPYRWTQALPPFEVSAVYDPKHHRFLVEVENSETGAAASAHVPASYQPVFGIDVADSEAINVEIARLIDRLKEEPLSVPIAPNSDAMHETGEDEP